MWLEESEVLKRINHEDNLCNPSKIGEDNGSLRQESETPGPEKVEEEITAITGEIRNRYGAGNGTPVDPAFRAFLGIVAQRDTIKNVQDNFGSNNVTICKAKRGLNSNGKPVEEGQLVKEVRDQFAEDVLDKMISVLPTIRAEEMDLVKIRDRAAIIKDLAQVHVALTPKQEFNITNSKIIIMSPGQGKESDYPVIEIEASPV